MPAPKGNLNAVKHGERLTRLTIGSLPDTMRRQTANALKYRRDLEDAVVATKGEVNLEDAHWIDQAAAAEIHCSINRWLLRERLAEMSVSDISKCSEQIMRSKDVRNRAFERLGLTEAESKMIAALYSVTPAHHLAEVSDPAPETTAESSRDGDASQSENESEANK